MTTATVTLPLREQLRAGLSRADQRRTPAAFLYDALGSALFDAITHLPEYGLTRVDRRLLAAHAPVLAAWLDAPLHLIELGPGDGSKARVLLAPALKRHAQATLTGVDVSAAALGMCARTLADLEGLQFVPCEAEFVAGLRNLSRLPGHRRVVAFLGSNLSNFERQDARQFLAQVRASLQPGDALLLSADLDKDPAMLLPAYDDALGVTAAFNRNVLVRLNREYGADFPLDALVHHAVWNADARRVEMHLRAVRDVHARVAGLDVEVQLRAGQSIWTESSHRFATAEVEGWAAACGLELKSRHVDEAWPMALWMWTATKENA